MAGRALNKNNSAVKRIMQEARELANDPSTDYHAAPLEDDIFEWHCTIRGTPGSEFEGGLYHFRILLPSEYPFRPPSIMVLTPNGRFELNTKICISFTNYHEELWQPAWGVRTAIIGIQGFFPLKGTAATGVGALEYPIPERKRLAALSRDWVCPTCKQSNLHILPDPPAATESPQSGPCVADVVPQGEPNTATETQHAPLPPSSDTDTSPPHVSVSRPSTPPPEMHATHTPHTNTITIPQPPMPSGTPSIVISSPTSPGVPSAETIAISRPIPLIAPKPTRPPTRPPVVDTPLSPPQSPPPTPTPTPSMTREPSPQPGFASTSSTTSTTTSTTRVTAPPRPPILLDTAICVLLVLAVALLFRRIV